MKKEIFTLVLTLLTFYAHSKTLSVQHFNAVREREIQISMSKDTVPDPETHLTLDILSKLPFGKSVDSLSQFLSAHGVFHVKLFNNNITLKNFDLNYFIVDGVEYTFSKFDFKDNNLNQFKRLMLIKDGKYTENDSRTLRNKEKQEYEDLAKSIERKLREKYGQSTDKVFKCGRNVGCRVDIGKSKTYHDGKDIIALFLTFETIE